MSDQRNESTGDKGGGARTGPQTSRSVKYSQEITSPDQEPERSKRP